MKIPIDQIKVTCAECGQVAIGDDINQDIVRYHKPSGSIIRLPSSGITAEQYQELKGMTLLCECCQEEKEEE
jgi:hypothetical protein